MLPFAPSRLCTLMPLNTHLFVRSMHRVVNTGTWPGRGLDRHKVRVGGRQVEIAKADVAVIAAHEIDRVAGLNWRVADLVCNVDAACH